jgi:hypothetical protein
VSQAKPIQLETDPRFPSGPWTGFFLQKALPGRHLMELQLTFSAGTLSGEGRDWVGRFVLRGHYSLADGKCRWVKRYVAKHDVVYRGFNEGKGIWGIWEIPGIADPAIGRGGFHIWPEGMADPSQPQLSEEAEPPLIVDEVAEPSEPVTVPGIAE